MEAVKIVSNQVGVLFLLIAVGFILIKANIIAKSTMKDMSSILLYIVVPTLLVKTYSREFKYNEMISLALAFLISIFFHVLGILISDIFIRKSNNDDYKMDKLSVVYSNCGFMAFPILSVVLGEDGIFYGSAFVAVFNIFLWTHGIKVLTDKSRLNIKKAIFNPGCIAVMLGLATYLFQIKYHPIINDTIDFISSLNTPIAMLVVGGMLADIKWSNFIDIKLLLASFMRILFVSFVGILILKFMKIYLINLNMMNVCISIALCAACPAASSITLIPASMGMEAARGAKIIAFTTICSIITLPLITFIIYSLFI